jgi:hypothetical protein
MYAREQEYVTAVWHLWVDIHYVVASHSRVAFGKDLAAGMQQKIERMSIEIVQQSRFG